LLLLLIYPDKKSTVASRVDLKIAGKENRNLAPLPDVARG
jgi:hypothetical protein